MVRPFEPNTLLIAFEDAAETPDTCGHVKLGEKQPAYDIILIA